VADGITIKIDGIKELQNTFKLISKDIEGIVSEATRDGGNVVKTAAKGHVHVITGRLKNSIDELHVIKSENKTEVQIGSTVPYAEVEEFRVGGKYPGPHSYLRWALDNSEAQVEATIKQSLEYRLVRYR
jgi:HK97 gp10 family phage protein